MARVDIVILMGVALALFFQVQSMPQKVTKRVQLLGMQQEGDSTQKEEYDISDVVQSIQNTLASLQERILRLETNGTRLADRVAVIEETLEMSNVHHKIMNGDTKEQNNDVQGNDGVENAAMAVTTPSMGDAQNGEEGSKHAVGNAGATAQGGDTVGDAIALLQEAETVIEQAAAVLSGNEQAVQSSQQTPNKKPNKDQGLEQPSQEPGQESNLPSQEAHQPSEPTPTRPPSEASEPSKPSQTHQPTESSQQGQADHQHSQIIYPGNNGGVAIHNGASQNEPTGNNSQPSDDDRDGEEGNAQGESTTGDETNKSEDVKDSNDKVEEERRNELSQALDQRTFRPSHRFLPYRGRVGIHSGR
ncbi:uncharacterized protein LOC110990674 [Acanthaster planci]|uniref:Uncharacterized protein LOC110990674 n=1 Tax=Acanthaster planci TaxID=133434 RepID=A0A8B8A3D7_ACAPL|nr:uncharacterized protein LOC110990674 [Acanthaster planci]